MEGRKAGRNSLSIDQGFNYKNHLFLAIKCCVGRSSAPLAPAMYAKTRPSTCPSIFAPRHAPLHHRPSHSLKNVGIFQNSLESLKFTSHQKLSAPPRAPPCFMVVKFKIRAQTFHIIIFHENAFLLMYRPNRLFGIRSFTMIRHGLIQQKYHIKKNHLLLLVI